MPRREFKGAAKPTRLNANILAADTSFDINSVSGWPSGGVNGPFNLTLDPDTAQEEHVTVTTRTGNTCSTVARGQDGTSAANHNVGADGTVIHGWFGQDADDVNAHIYLTARDDHTQYMKADGTRHDLTARHSAGTVVPTAVAGTSVVGATATEGTGTNAARATHTHALPTAAPVATGTALSVGSGGLFVHSNHVHTIGAGSINNSNMFAADVVNAAAVADASIDDQAKIVNGIITLAKFASEASTDYTPTAASFANTTTLTIGTGGTTYGHYFKLGRLVVGWAGFSMAADGNLPAGGNIQIPLPVAMRTVGSDGFRCFVAARARRGSDGNVVSGTGVITGGSSNAVNIAAAGTAATWDATTPFNWGTPGDGACVIDSVFVYEAAT